MEIQAFQRTRFTFNKIEPTKVIIEGKQPNFYQEGSSDRLFQYGFQNIDISFDEYQTSQAKIITKFDISKYNKKFKLISVPTAREAMGSLKNINNYIEHRLYYLTNGDTTISEYDFNADLPVLDCDKIYISTTIKAVNGVSPLISNIAVGFETR
jgi:hypothetical protein